MDNLMTKAQYETNLADLKRYFLDLDYTNLSPDLINTRLSTVLANFTKVTDYMIGAAINLNVAKKQVKAVKLEKDVAYNSNMFHEEVFSQKSKELREAKCSLLSQANEKALLAAEQAELDANAYYSSVKFIYENLETALGAMREQVKLFQNMLYLDPSGHR